MIVGLLWARIYLKMTMGNYVPTLQLLRDFRDELQSPRNIFFNLQMKQGSLLKIQRNQHKVDSIDDT